MSNYPYSTQELDTYRHTTDFEAEEVVTKLFAHYQLKQINTLFRSISEYPYKEDIPVFFKTFVEHPGRIPEWTDWQKVNKACEVFQNYGREIILALLCRSLPMCYICANGAHVLTTTARLVDLPHNPNYTRRLLETMQFVINVCQGGILNEGGSGLIAIRKVRLIHATIRRYIHDSMPWPEHLGAPINQEDQLITMSAFGLEVVKALDKMGIYLSGEEREAWCHLWSLVGYLLGIQEHLLPLNYAAFETMSANILASQARKSEDGQLLCLSCVEFMSGLLPHRALYSFSYATFKYINDEPYRHMMGFGGTHRIWDWLMPKILRSTLGIDQKIERRSPLLKRMVRYLNGLLMKGLSRTVRKNEQYFYLPAGLRT